ncbi:MAG: hypothetical protein CVV27_10495 [Candidatus Melainabacteria bacterium HGW-Melainabacteria-1]|nr:MAG: hypothetical protein CVV27_10495 [Candidatus Melainabacteria bacterium HGW-Melainabacteria-1]
MGALAFGCLLPTVLMSTHAVSAKLELPNLESIRNLSVSLGSMFRPVELEQIAQPAPAPSEIPQGAILEAGQSGRSVLLIKRLLQELDYPVRSGDFYDQNLATQIGAYQARHQLARPGSVHWGKVGPSTLRSLRNQAILGRYDDAFGRKLASYARSQSSGGQGSCYRYVALAIHAHLGPVLNGMHAYMASPYLARNERFREIKVPVQALKRLPAGAVVVWDKGSSRSGHISIADGQGREISDHVAPQMLSHYGGAGYRVFVPIARPKAVST